MRDRPLSPRTVAHSQKQACGSPLRQGNAPADARLPLVKRPDPSVIAAPRLGADPPDDQPCEKATDGRRQDDDPRTHLTALDDVTEKGRFPVRLEGVIARPEAEHDIANELDRCVQGRGRQARQDSDDRAKTDPAGDRAKFEVSSQARQFAEPRNEWESWGSHGGRGC